MTKKPAAATENDKSESSQNVMSAELIDLSSISLETLGAHMFFGEVDTASVHRAIEFLLKTNIVYREPRELTLILNTIGGSCYDGFALIDVMDASRHTIKTVGMGNIVSMGVLLLCAGEKGKRVMTRNTQVMAHQFYGVVGGKFHELISAYKSELYLEQQFLEHFLRHTKMNEKQIRDVMFGPSDRWLSPTECKKLGLVDHVVDELPEFSFQIQTSRAEKSKPRSRK